MNVIATLGFGTRAEECGRCGPQLGQMSFAIWVMFEIVYEINKFF